MGRLTGRIAGRGTRLQVRYVTPVPPGRARGQVERVYAQVERDFGLLAPPISLHSPAPGTLAAAWMMLREALVATGRARREAKETVAVAVSRANSCPYCVEVHSAALYGLVPARRAAAIARGQPGPPGPADLARLATWAGGRTPPSAAPAATAYPPALGPELIGTAVTFQYLNRMVNAFLVASPIPAGVPERVRPVVTRLAGWTLRRVLRRPVAPGRSLELLPAAPLPSDLGWAAGSPTVAEAFARAAASLTAAGERAVPPSVRELVCTELDGWDGEPPGPGGGWVRERVAAVPADCRPVARLALLVAKASYQVTSAVIGECRRIGVADRGLIEVAAWASMAAARQAGVGLWRGLGAG